MLEAVPVLTLTLRLRYTFQRRIRARPPLLVNDPDAMSLGVIDYHALMIAHLTQRRHPRPHVLSVLVVEAAAWTEEERIPASLDSTAVSEVCEIASENKVAHSSLANIYVW